MDLTWHGQAAFRLVDEGGCRIVRDPRDPELLGYAPIADACELVIDIPELLRVATITRESLPASTRYLVMDYVRQGPSPVAEPESAR